MELEFIGVHVFDQRWRLIADGVRADKIVPTATSTRSHSHRDAGAGGGEGAVGATCPPTCKLWELRSPTLDCRCRSFIFLFVFARELGSLPKNSGLNPGSF